ncbi:MAG: isoprenyl transferase [Lachnospiraceae bacterium]|nr:isoprenyl transferase [Lachnospiraceae bacterium]
MAKQLDPAWKIPEHVAIIMDGNGRWAKRRGLPRNMGHRQGGKAVEAICEDAYHLGIKYLTVYAFSTENWSRPQDEIAALMNLLRSYMKDCVRQAEKNKMRVKIIGDISKLDEDLQESIRNLVEKSKNNDGLCFQIALNYGGRDELLRAIQGICQDVKNEALEIEDISQNLIAAYLDTADVPDPDLLIRTSGEQRISNFLLWQLAYTEFYFPDVLWPDFTKDDLIDAIAYYNTRERRYGGVINV